jgi:hypothetical protein
MAIQPEGRCKHVTPKGVDERRVPVMPKCITGCGGEDMMSLRGYLVHRAIAATRSSIQS